MAVIGIDELNVVPSEEKKGRAIPYQEYFEEMDLTDAEVAERIEAANLFEEMFLFFFALIAMYGSDAADNYDFLLTQMIGRFQGEIERVMPLDDYLYDYATRQSGNILQSTIDHIDDEWYLSHDRAMWDAENTANDVCNYEDYESAIAAGMKSKTWVAFVDNKTREHHKQVNGRTIGIYKLFKVGSAYMRFPKDYDMAWDYPQETVGCRCKCDYLPYEVEDDFANSFDYQSMDKPNNAPSLTVPATLKVADRGIPEKNNNSEDNTIRGKYASYTKENITQSFLESSTPGIGEMIKEDGFKDVNDEESIANWIFNTFGGRITLRSDVGDQLSPDYLWDGKFWDLKSLETNTFNTLEKRLKHGLKQIESSPGGLVYNIKSKSDWTLEEAEKHVDHVMYNHLSFSTRIIIKKGDDFKILEYIKK